jgi:response regulator RpfG family c-di-GMP phosphodiesterase
MKNTKYCLCCDEQVPFSVIERQDKREERCIYCGFVLDIQQTGPPRISAEKGYALIADDSKYTRKMITEILQEKNYSGHIKSFENGAGLVSAYEKLTLEKERIDVAIIDLNMPVMDGIRTAMTVRILEAQKDASNVPIIFFSGVKADEDLKRILEELAPAVYLNKSADPDPDKLAKRVEELVGFILTEYARK